MVLTQAERAELQRLLAKASEPEAGYDPASGLVRNVVTGEMDSVWDIGSGAEYNSATGLVRNVATGEMVRGCHAASYAPPAETTGSPGPKMNNQLPALPETIMQLGVLKDLQMSYQQISESEDERCQKYVQWCRSRVDSLTGQALDFAKYLMHHFANEKVDSGLIIPGTSQKRMMKP